MTKHSGAAQEIERKQARLADIESQINRLLVEAFTLRQEIAVPAPCKTPSGRAERGIAVLVAEQLGVTSGTVRKVREGKAVSARISSALSVLALNVCAEPLPSALAPDELRELAYGGRYYGLFSRAAKSSGLSRKSIADAAHGRTKSRIALEHLRRHMTSMRGELTAEQPDNGLREEQRFVFRPGGRYYGSVTRVARRLQTSPGNVHNTLSGRRNVPRILHALRAEMARIDGSIGAQQKRLVAA